MKINKYKIKDNIIPNSDFLTKYGFRKGGSWITKNTTHYIDKFIKIGSLECAIDIGININDINSFDDFDDIIVIDNDWAQPYTPFYNYYHADTDDIKNKYVVNLIEEYNKYMDSLDFLEKIE